MAVVELLKPKLSDVMLWEHREPWGSAEGGKPEILKTNFHLSEQTLLIFHLSCPLWFPVVFIAAVFFLNGLLRGSHDCDSFKSGTYIFYFIPHIYWMNFWDSELNASSPLKTTVCVWEERIILQT